MIQKDIKEIIKKLKMGFDKSDLEMKKELVMDYNDLIDLRNRLKENDNTLDIYEEDSILLDNILDFMEIIFEKLISEDERKIIIKTLEQQNKTHKVVELW